MRASIQWSSTEQIYGMVCYKSSKTLHTNIDSDGQLINKHYDKRYDFKFSIDMKQHSRSTCYGVYISQLRRNFRACVYQDFLHRDLLPTVKLLEKGFMVVKLKSPRWKCLPSPSFFTLLSWYHTVCLYHRGPHTYVHIHNTPQHTYTPRNYWVHLII